MRAGLFFLWRWTAFTRHGVFLLLLKALQLLPRFQVTVILPLSSFLVPLVGGEDEVTDSGSVCVFGGCGGLCVCVRGVAVIKRDEGGNAGRSTDKEGGRPYQRKRYKQT